MLCFRVAVFCVLVCLLLYVLFCYLHNGSIAFIFSQKCYRDDKNGQVIFEHASNNNLKERLVGLDVNTTDLTSFVSEDEEFDEIINVFKNIMNVNDPRSKNKLSDSDITKNNDIVGVNSDERITVNENGYEEVNTTTESDLLISILKRKKKSVIL